MDGTTYELTESFAREGGYVTVGRSLIDPQCSVWVEHDEVRIPLRPVDPVANSKRKRQAAPEPEKTVDFDPATALVERTIGRSRRPKG